ncbi:MAG: hypothetical protein HYR85_01625 [Planctomycetes bacterium]|nr:hypothetical protein [Planctomycetota bacterium]MBI3845966.1 hypothetical protein [Planctomycetota bacterium]
MSGKVVEVDVVAAKESLRDCLAWCDPAEGHRAIASGDLPRYLRSEALESLAGPLRPGHGFESVKDQKPVRNWDAVYAQWHRDFQFLLTTGFLEFVRRRRELVARSTTDKAVTNAEVESEWVRPRSLLLYSPLSNLFCGAAEQVTNGYFDVENIPAWDTWLAFGEIGAGWSHPCLITWVPEWLSEIVENGIQVNPEACIAWATVAEDGLAAIEPFG